jgi:hypothetical protein
LDPGSAPAAAAAITLQIYSQGTVIVSVLLCMHGNSILLSGCCQQPHWAPAGLVCPAGDYPGLCVKQLPKETCLLMALTQLCRLALLHWLPALLVLGAPIFFCQGSDQLQELAAPAAAAVAAGCLAQKKDRIERSVMGE